MAAYDTVIGRRITHKKSSTSMSLGSSVGTAVAPGAKTNMGGSTRTFTSATTSIAFKTFLGIWYIKPAPGQVVYEVTNTGNRPDVTVASGTARGYSISKLTTHSFYPGYYGSTQLMYRYKSRFYDTNPSQSGTMQTYDATGGSHPVSYPFSWFMPARSLIANEMNSIGGHPSGSYENWYIHSSFILFGIYGNGSGNCTGINFGNGNASMGSWSGSRTFNNLNSESVYNLGRNFEVNQVFWFKDGATGQGAPGFGGFVCLSMYMNDSNGAAPDVVMNGRGYVEINGQPLSFQDTVPHKDEEPISSFGDKMSFNYMWHVPDSVIDAMNTYATNANTIRFYKEADEIVQTGVGTAFGKSNSNIKMSDLRKTNSLFSNVPGNSTSKTHLRFLSILDSFVEPNAGLPSLRDSYAGLPTSGTIKISDFEEIYAPIWSTTGLTSSSGTTDGMADSWSDRALTFLNSANVASPHSNGYLSNIGFSGLIGTIFEMSLGGGYSYGKGPSVMGIINNDTNEPILYYRIDHTTNYKYTDQTVHVRNYIYRHPDFMYNPYDPPVYFIISNFGNYPDNTSITIFFG